MSATDTGRPRRGDGRRRRTCDRCPIMPTYGAADGAVRAGRGVVAVGP